MKNASDGLISRLGTTEKRISEIDDIHQQNPQNQKAKTTKTERNNIQGMLDNYKRYNIHEMGILGEERKEQNI